MKSTHISRLTSSFALSAVLLFATFAPSHAGESLDQADAQFYTQQEAPVALESPNFYAIPSTLPQEKGALIKSEPMKFWRDAKQTAPGNAKTATRIMYTSTNSKGEQVAITGAALTSPKKWTGQGERPVVVLAPGTQGLGDSCAPSSQLEAGTEYEQFTIAPLLDAGYNVVVTDYLGSGTKGTHSYLNRQDQGNAVLDAARAALDPALGMGTAISPIGIWGYSQGGGAAASAAELQPSYAPELNLKGVYAGAVPADLQAVVNKIDGTLYNGFMLMGLAGLGDSYGIDFTQYLNAEGLKILEQAREVCTGDSVSAFGSVRDTGKWTLSGKKISEVMASDPTFQGIMKENDLGAPGRAPQVPILIASSWGDDVIPHKSNRELAHKYCQAGSRVSFYMDGTPTHAMASLVIIPRGLIFMDRQFKGLPSSQDCWQVGA